jgi:hypothetical protein
MIRGNLGDEKQTGTLVPVFSFVSLRTFVLGLGRRVFSLAH